MPLADPSAVARLRHLVGDLEPAPDGQTAELDEARRIAARAVRSGRAPGPSPSSPDGGQVASLEQLLEEAGDEGEAFLVHRRSLPAFATGMTAVPSRWSASRRVDHSLGPFRDAAGRDVWIDLYRRAALVRLVRSAGEAPFLALPLAVSSPPTGAAAEYAVPAGSVWFASQLFAPDAGLGSYTGLRIKSGILRFSQALPTVVDMMVVHPGISVELDLEIDLDAPVGGTGPGGDSRAADVEMPHTARLTFGASSGTIRTDDTARLRAYGFETELEPSAAPVRYLSDLHRLSVPFTARAGPFVVSQADSELFRPAGVAKIADAGWGLPVAELADPEYFGEASGPGALILSLKTGLRATWLGQSEPVDLGPAWLLGETNRVSLVATRARGEHVHQAPRLPGSSRERFEVSWAPAFPVSFESEAAGSELVLSEAAVSAIFDQPVDVRGERLAMESTAAWIGFGADADGQIFGMEAELVRPAGKEDVAFGLLNAVLLATYPKSFFFHGRYDGSELSTGELTLVYNRLLGLLPTLPDPYAANYDSLRSGLGVRGERLKSRLTWDGTARDFDFRLGYFAPAPLERGRAPFGILEAAGDPGMVANREARNEGIFEAVGDALDFERDRGLILLDVSTNVDQLGVAFRSHDEERPELELRDLALHAGGRDLVLLTLPAVQWEAVHTVSDPDPTFPSRLGFVSSGVPSVIDVPTVDLVPVHPSAALRSVVDNFAGDAPDHAAARFTLPFGAIARVHLRAADPDKDTRGTLVSLNRPRGGTLEGAHQLRIDAVDLSLAPGESPSLPGHTAQLPIGQPGYRSALGDSVTSIFNSYLGAAGARPLVPVTRLDVSGYGQSLFSDWRNPYADPAIDAAAVVQARFDVLVGRTAYEVVQVRSYLFPYAVEVVRTITIERRNNAAVTRRDSGWVAVSDGTYRFLGAAIRTHPGVVRRITNVGHIRETGQVRTVDGVDLAAVYFDGDLDLDGAARPAAVTDQFGFVQITGGGLIGPGTYANLLTAAGPLGGPVDADIHVGGGNQVLHVHRVDVGFAGAFGVPEFVMTAWTAPAFPGGGEWSVLQVEDPGGAPQAVPRDRGLPLIRAGYAEGPPWPAEPYRFADPADLARPDNPDRDYGILHATGTQRVFFRRPKIETSDPSRITSSQIPVLADPYSLATAIGLFPELGRTIPFPSATWALRVDTDGNYRLELPASTFPAGVGRRTTRQAGSVKSDLDYTAATVTYEVDTSQPVPWRFRLDGAAKIMNTSTLGDVIRLESNVVATAGTPTVFEEPQLKMGGALSVVQDLLTLLADLGITGTMRVDMTNEMSLSVTVSVPVVDKSGKPFQIPPIVPLPDIKFDDTGLKVETAVLPTSEESEFSLHGSPMFAIKTIPGLYAVAIIELSIKVSTEDGTTYSFLVGLGFAYEIDAGPFGFKGLLALTYFGFVGDTTLGMGIGFVAKLSASLDPIISIEVSLEGRMALIRSCIGSPVETLFSAAKLTFGVEVSVCLVFSISFEVETTASTAVLGPGEPACALPGVI